MFIVRLKFQCKITKNHSELKNIRIDQMNLNKSITNSCNGVEDELGNGMWSKNNTSCA